jgi:hypothetical protein
MRKPNFFLVGAPKCGTTAMDSYLAQHPDIFMAGKETNYFSREMFRDKTGRAAKLRETSDFYDSLFEGAGDETIVGESSVFYMSSTEAAGRIRDYAPDARILIHIRNPVDFIPSHHSQLVFERYEDITDVVAAYDAEDDRRSGRRMPELCPLHTILHYRQMAMFSEQIERYFDAFGRERVLVNVVDDLKADPSGVYRRTLAFLGVDPSFQPTFDVVNANKRFRSGALVTVLREPPDWVSAVSRLVAGPETRLRLKRMLKRLNTAYEARAPLDPAFLARLRNDLRPEVERLSALLDRDLTHWCREPEGERRRDASRVA